MSDTTKTSSLANRTANLVSIAMMTAIVCVLGPIAITIPMSPVPISLGSLGLYIIIYILGPKRGAISCLLYILLGLAGTPVFTGFTGGVAKLFGPTGGYIIGYLPMTLIIGFFIEKFEKKWIQFAGYIVGTAVLYLFGTLWLAISAEMGFYAALFAGVIPFIPGDIAKMAAAMIIGPLVRKALNKAGLMLPE